MVINFNPCTELPQLFLNGYGLLIKIIYEHQGFYEPRSKYIAISCLRSEALRYIKIHLTFALTFSSLFTGGFNAVIVAFRSFSFFFFLYRNWESYSRMLIVLGITKHTVKRDHILDVLLDPLHFRFRTRHDSEKYLRSDLYDISSSDHWPSDHGNEN